MCLAQGPQRSDPGEAGTHGHFIFSQALNHCAPKQGWAVKTTPVNMPKSGQYES